MKGTATRALQIGAGLMGLVTLGWVLTGQAAPPAGPRPAEQGVPTDWTHRHVIFSQPANAEQAMRAASDPRYWQQWYRDHIVRTLPESSVASSGESLFQPHFTPAARASVQHDWAQNLGNLASVGAGNFPAKFSFHTNVVHCGNTATPDYVVFSTGLLGSGTQASIVAFDNLWIGCGGTIPTVFWAYNTGGQILTSPVLSQDGTQIAFVQTNGGAAASLVLLKWKSSKTQTVSNPGVPATAANGGAYLTCAAPCMLTIALKGGDGFVSNDTGSSVFYDYSGDTAWVGDSRGWLHKFHPVFLAASAEVRSAPWPVQLNPGNPAALASPAHDLSSGNVFVGDAGGFFYRVNTTTAPGQVTSTAKVDFGTGVDGGPIVDVTSQLVYVFASSDGTTNCAGAHPCAAIYQLPTNFAGGTTGTKVVVGSAGSALTPNPLFDGQFDNTYRNSANATGTFYVCGNTGGAPTVYQIPVNAGVLGTPVAGPVLASATTGCSPISDVLNGGSEWIFASAQASGTGNSCAAGGCIMNFDDQAWKTATAFAVKQEILDTHFQIQVVQSTSGSGLSGVVTPSWSTVPGATTADGHLVWVNQGPQTPSHGAWKASTAFALGTEILDSNGNIQLVIHAGTSQATAHVWNQSPGGHTAESGSTLLWEEVGALATVSAPENGGTSGIIMDSTVAGASEVYFTTLSNQVCGTTGTGGCAVQASQSALK